ncbi:hypothetical protein ETAA8_04390 [Anatilimnocola aggregata]|uniref:3-keto-alpha-glucoside-1,2-lyase/3-keto-2-hydroxy-glucal hydratase domain-containing protein n=1 Tax=Anatilimnocola aggregata TaxID=2528021 RepID=A0A517Y554_9BACT|nr:DUF1080 domain-containing protein [Anatilimnocola aggregata]QDU25373.1 hypothetical protein ETAA8_04390 [Anatilimnocola aggregata]
MTHSIRIALLFGILFSTSSLMGQEKPVDPKVAAAVEWKPLFDGKSIKGWKSINFGGEGEITVEKGSIILGTGDPLTGIVIEKAEGLPKDNYEITLEANRLEGDDFFCGLTFPVGDSHASFICGGWGGGLVGISSLDGMDASENTTTGYKKFESNKWYRIRVRVAGGQLQAFIDKENFADVKIADHKISTRFEVDITRPLGVSAYRTKAGIRDIKWRTVKEAEKVEEKK